MYQQLCSWDNLYLAWRSAAADRVRSVGKRGKAPAARFEFRSREIPFARLMKSTI
jgi:hypothetical protein